MALAIAGLMLRSAPVEQVRRIRDSMAGLTVVRPERSADRHERDHFNCVSGRVGEQLRARLLKTRPWQVSPARFSLELVRALPVT